MGIHFCFLRAALGRLRTLEKEYSNVKEDHPGRLETLRPFPGKGLLGWLTGDQNKEGLLGLPSGSGLTEELPDTCMHACTCTEPTQMEMSPSYNSITILYVLDSSLRQQCSQPFCGHKRAFPEELGEVIC